MYAILGVDNELGRASLFALLVLIDSGRTEPSLWSCICLHRDLFRYVRAIFLDSQMSWLVVFMGHTTAVEIGPAPT